MTNEYGEAWLREANAVAFQHQPSGIVFDQVFAEAFDEGDTLYVIVGSDSGLLPIYLRKFCNKRRKFILVEDDELLHVIEQRKPEIIKKQQCIEILPASTFSFEQLSEKYPEYIDHNRFRLVRSLGVLDKISESQLKLWLDMLEKHKIFQYLQNATLGTRRFFDIQIFNLPFNEHPISLLENSLADKSVIVLGGGPTLDSGIEWIKANREQVIIAAVTRIALRLIKEGITPDFYAAVDPNDVSYDNAKWVTTIEGQTLLLHTNYTHPALIGEWRNAHLFTDFRFPWNTENEVKNLVTSGPTVTNTLIQLMVHLGARNIYLLGVDFCYGAHGETHESGSIEAKLGGAAHHTDLRIETYSGRMALTNTVFYQAAKSLEKFAEIAYKERGTRIYQLGKESARIENIPLMCFDAITLNDSAIQKDTLNNIQNHLNFDSHKHAKFLSNLQKEVHKQIKSIQEIKSLAHRGLERSRQLFINMGKLDRLTSEIIKIKKKLSNKYKDEFELLYRYAVGSYKDFMSPRDNDKEQSQEEIKQDLINYFNALHKNASDFLVSLESARHHIQIEMSALNPEKLEDCARFWVDRNMEGRIYWWLKIHNKSLTALPTHHRKIAQKLMQLYEEKLNNELDTKLAKRLQQLNQNLETHINMVDELFESGNAEGLHTLINTIKDDQSERAHSLKALARGYLLDLNGQENEALEAYLQVKDSALLKQALTRIAQIALSRERLDVAMPALELLTRYDDRYFVVYADLLASQGDLGGAVQLYDYYLQKHKDDLTVWLKAARTTLKGQDYSAAHQCAEYVLHNSQDPTIQKEAKKLLEKAQGALTS